MESTPVDTAPVAAGGTELCGVLPAPAVARVLGQPENTLSATPPISRGISGGGVDDCAVYSSKPGAEATIRITPNGTYRWTDNSEYVAENRADGTPLTNPLLLSGLPEPSIALVIGCHDVPVHLQLSLIKPDARRPDLRADAEALVRLAAATYSARQGCPNAPVLPPLPEERLGTARVLAGTGAAAFPSTAGSGHTTPVGYVEAMTTAADGSLYLVSRVFPADLDPSRDDFSHHLGSGPWGQSLRILRVHPSGRTEIAWDPTTALRPEDSRFHTRGADSLGMIGSITVRGQHAWLTPRLGLARPNGDASAPATVVLNLTTGRADDLRAMIEANPKDTTRITDETGRVLTDPLTGTYDRSAFAAVSGDRGTTVLLDVASSRLWQLGPVRDGKIISATLTALETPVSNTARAVALPGGRFAVAENLQAGNRLRVINSSGTTEREIPLAYQHQHATLRLGAAGEDVLVNALGRDPAVLRVNSRTGATTTVMISGASGIKTAPTGNATIGYGTTRYAATLFSVNQTGTRSTDGVITGSGGNVVLAPAKANTLYELIPNR